MRYLYLFLIGLAALSFANDAHAQSIINLTASTPCFLNYSAGVQMWQNCGYGNDFVKGSLAPFEWVTGGLFSPLIVAILIIMTYIKYHTMLYPIIIGIVFLPTAYYLFPPQFLSAIFIMAGLGIASAIWYGLHRTTRDV